MWNKVLQLVQVCAVLSLSALLTVCVPLTALSRSVCSTHCLFSILLAFTLSFRLTVHVSDEACFRNIVLQNGIEHNVLLHLFNPCLHGCIVLVM